MTSSTNRKRRATYVDPHGYVRGATILLVVVIAVLACLGLLVVKAWAL